MTSVRYYALVASLAVSAMLFAFCSSAEAQQPAKIPRIGFLGSGSPSAYVSRTEAFRQGLRELGYVEGKTIAIEYRYAEGLTNPLPDLVADLVRVNVQIIVTSSTPATLALKNGTKTIPIVFVAVADPVGSGLVVSLARPGGNLTGLSTNWWTWSGKTWSYSSRLFQKSRAWQSLEVRRIQTGQSCKNR